MDKAFPFNAKSNRHVKEILVLVLPLSTMTAYVSTSHAIKE
jgi:hypothetical protein